MVPALLLLFLILLLSLLSSGFCRLTDASAGDSMRVVYGCNAVMKEYDNVTSSFSCFYPFVR